MRDADKAKEHLIRELSEMRQRIAELEYLRDYRSRAEEARQRACDKWPMSIISGPRPPIALSRRP